MRKLGLGYQALIAVILGVAVGLFFGPLCSVLEPVGTAFIMLLQMVVLPYIPTLLMHGLGSLSPETAKKLFQRGWFFLLMLWLIVFGSIYALKVLIPIPLPDPSTDFSNEKIEFTRNFLTYIIPQNPFYDLAHNVVPAIALFSLILGVAIMHLKEKEPLLGMLEKTNASLEKIIKWLAVVSPIGIFAHIANAMGTVNLADLAKLELYVVITILSTIFLSLWVLPMIVSCLTSIPYRQLMKEYRIVCILAFATGIPSIAFPFINNCMRRLGEKNNLDLATFRSTSQTVVPLAYSFAQIGNFFLLLFIFFMSFYYRHPLSEVESLFLPLLTVPISFGTPQLSLAGMSFLTDNLDFPREAFTLFVETTAITLNFQVLLSVAAMLTFIMLVILRYYDLLKINWSRLFSQVGCMFAVLFTAVIVGKQFVNIQDNYRDLYYRMKMSDLIEHPPQVTAYRERIPLTPSQPNTETLSRVLQSNVLKVGYDIYSIPFCYLNEWNEIIGYDMAYAYQLAKDLDVKLELIPIDYDKLAQDLNSGYFDIAMSAILMTDDRVVSMDFARPYMQQPNALVVPVKNVEKFRNLAVIKQNPNLKIGGAGGYRAVVNKHFKTGVLFQMQGFEELLSGKVDALMWSELPAYIWCMAHPDFTTLSYDNQLGLKYFSYPMKSGSSDMITFVNEWMTLKSQSGFKKDQDDYWIHGRTSVAKEPRWSIIRNVLHWVK